MAKKFTFRGKSLEEISSMDSKQLSELLNSRQRRSLKRGFRVKQKKLLINIRKLKGKDVLIKTHLRDMIIMPEMVGTKIGIHNGKEFISVTIDESKIGHYLGEFALTRQKVKHSAPGLGATRSSKFVPLK
ncbi:MAG: 30S ribosomal protein S19 [Candidatus Aenigmarchaeota archaeon]|nr:30S ribosomal protein S19 [Candidatus Aenigmarchaeota archaeon]